VEKFKKFWNKLLILLMALSSLVIAEETFMQEIVGLAQPLFILSIFVLPPIIITLLIVGIVKFIGKGVSLTADLFKDDEED